MKVLGIISGLTDPSSRARILQYRSYLEKEQIKVDPRYFSPHSYADPAPWAYRLNKVTKISPWRFLWMQKTISRLPLLLQQYQYDLIWQNRLILPHQFFFERKITKPIVFDFDDAIWLGEGEKQVIQAMERAALIFAGNDYLAEFAIKHNPNTVVIPSVIDTTALYPLPPNNKFFTIGWIGTKTNFNFLALVKPAVLNFLSRHHDSRLLIVSSEKPPQFDFDNERIIFKKWSAEKENELINEFSIGLMPLEDNDFTRGKCSYKMLQYMACSRPVVVSPVGNNSSILHKKEVGLAARGEEDWLKAFTLLKNDVAYYRTCAENGRNLVVENYSVEKFYPVIARHFTELTAR
ncbi:MAG: glycosyltransferase [Bacteroidota bacterium]|nr:glycosyltransferase [Bacteroidota bacterium]